MNVGKAIGRRLRVYVQGKSTRRSKDKFEKDLKACEEARMEILRLTNIAYASVRIQVRESRVGDEFGRKMTAESMLTERPLRMSENTRVARY